MDNDGKADLLTAMGWLTAAYEGRLGVNVTPEKLDVYVSMLADLPLDRLKQTIRYWIANEPRFPTVADLRLDCIKRRLNAPEPHAALRMLVDRSLPLRNMHDLIQAAYDSAGGVHMEREQPDKFPGLFITTYRALVESEIREFNEFSLENHRGRGSADDGGAAGGGAEGDRLPASVSGGRGNRVRPAAGDNGLPAIPHDQSTGRRGHPGRMVGIIE